jgi:hypothetical protein
MRLRVPNPVVTERGRSASFDLTRTMGALPATATLFSSRILHPVLVTRTTTYELTNAPGRQAIAAWSSSARGGKSHFR